MFFLTSLFLKFYLRKWDLLRFQNETLKKRKFTGNQYKDDFKMKIVGGSEDTVESTSQELEMSTCENVESVASAPEKKAEK